MSQPSPPVPSDPALLTGLSDHHVVMIDGIPLHRELEKPLAHLQAAARMEGIELAVASGFRSFERQLHIWNAKAHGERTVLDEQGHAIDIAQLSPRDRVFAILRWSALPGTSRHHWGTDIDVWDPSAVQAQYRLQLIPQEYESRGPFARLGRWMDIALNTDGADFYRPYAIDEGGVAPEPWHLSYRPLADYYAAQLTPGLLAPMLEKAAEHCGEELVLFDTVLRHLDEIFARFVAR